MVHLPQHNSILFVIITLSGRCGTIGVSTEKNYPDEDAAATAMARTISEKMKKGYVMSTKEGSPCETQLQVSALTHETAGTPGTEGMSDAEDSLVSGSNTTSAPTGDLKLDLEYGIRVFVQGGSALPYTLKKFNGGYSCTCKGWTSAIRSKGIQSASCKHLKLVRGEEEERIRCDGGGGDPSTTAALPQSSRKANKFIPPKISLANPWKPTTDPAGYLMSEKLDGMRAYWSEGKLWTRNGLPIVAPTWFIEDFPADLELDGELFLDRKMFEECMSITRRTDGLGEWHRITYVVFDAPRVAGGIVARLDAASMALSRAGSKYAKIHPHTTCSGFEHVVTELARVQAVGGEGLMLRHATATHRGGRTSDLLKVKTFQDDEAVVTGYEDGKGKHVGVVGALVCVSRTGARFKVGSGLTDAQRQPNIVPKIGSVITYKYFELSADGVPRFPTFLRSRPDVDAADVYNDKL